MLEARSSFDLSMERVAAFAMKYGWVIGLVAVVVVGATGYYFFGQGDKSKAAPESVKKIEQRTPEEELRLEINIAVSGVGAELKQAVPTYGGWLVHAEFTESEVDLATTLEGALKLFGELGRIEMDLAEAVILFRTDDLRDVYGNQLKEVVIARIGLDGATFEQVNWQGFEILNFPRITADFWLHDELETQWADLEMKQRQESQGGTSGGSGGQGGGGQGGGPGGGGQSGASGAG